MRLKLVGAPSYPIKVYQWLLYQKGYTKYSVGGSSVTEEYYSDPPNIELQERIRRWTDGDSRGLRLDVTEQTVWYDSEKTGYDRQDVWTYLKDTEEFKAKFGK